MRKIRVGIVGLGHMGLIHLANCLRLKEYCNVAAVADISRAALSDIRGLGIKSYSSYLEMVEKEKVDAIIISLPNYLHKDACLLAAEEGCDIFLEKPLAMDINKGREIVNSVKKSGIKLMMGMCQRFIKGIKELKKVVNEGVLGHIIFASTLLYMLAHSGVGVKLQNGGLM